MWRVIFSTYKKNRIGIIRAVPWSFMVSRIVTGITQIVFPYFIYYYFMNGNMNKEFGAYAEGADYMTYVVLGSALNVLAVSVLMNIGRALITELREGTLEVLLLSPAPRKNYFVGCLLEQTTRALIEFGTVLVIGALLGANLRYFFSFQTIIVVLLAVLSFFCMGITLSSVMLYTRDTYLTQNVSECRTELIDLDPHYYGLDNVAYLYLDVQYWSQNELKRVIEKINKHKNIGFEELKTLHRLLVGELKP